MKTSQHSVLIGVAVFALVTVTAVLAAGPSRFGPSRWFTPKDPPGLPAPRPTPMHTPAPMPRHGHFPPWIAVIAAILIAAALCWLVARAVLRARRPRRFLTEPPGATVTCVMEAEAHAAIMNRGLRLALDALDREREAADAITAAWLGLQSAAEDSGVKRRAAETPTEFTARVITRVGADGEAAQRLVAVYETVRFGGHPITRGDAHAARAALEALLASWPDPSWGGRTVTRPARGRVVGVSIGAVLVLTPLCWLQGAALPLAFAIALVVSAAVGVSQLRIRVTGPGWPRHPPLVMVGVRDDVHVLGLAVATLGGRAQPAALEHAHRVVRAALRPRGLELDSTVDRSCVIALIGETAYLTLHSNVTNMPTLDELLAALRAVDGLGRASQSRSIG